MRFPTRHPDIDDACYYQAGSMLEVVCTRYYDFYPSEDERKSVLFELPSGYVGTIIDVETCTTRHPGVWFQDVVTGPCYSVATTALLQLEN